MAEFIAARHRNRLGLFVSDVLKTGREVGILTMLDHKGEEHHIELYAQLTRGDEGEKVITGFGREVTERIERQKKQLTDRKFQGVLEMAGGVAHSLNQPLTVVNNLLNEVMADMSPDDSIYDSVMRIYDQIQKLNNITKKIREIQKYEAMDYVCGERIVDIDKASLKK
jgi:signal transduction histidine kinase